MSGYSFKLRRNGSVFSSGWLGADKMFTTPEFQSRYDKVDISLFTPKFALVPAQFFNPEASRQALSDVVRLGESDSVEYVPVPEFAAVLVYSNSMGESLSKAIAHSVVTASGETSKILPEMYYILKEMTTRGEYNKIIASYMDGRLHLAVAQGKNLMLCNAYEAVDFTTAEYFIFLAMKKLQLNPEVSSIVFRTPLSGEQEMSLYRYFKAVEQI